MKKNAKPKKTISIEDYDFGRADGVKRASLPSGEYSGLPPADVIGRPVPELHVPLPAGPDLSDAYAARDPALDPQYIWRGKVRGDLNELCAKAPPLFVQERVSPRTLIEAMRRRTERRRSLQDAQMTFEDLEEDFFPEPGDFYRHEEGWSNRLIQGDSLHVMASLLENENLRGRVQMIYIDPPYGIKFNSNWQPTTKSTNVKDGKAEDLTREPEMVKAFRDTWTDGIHSYLTYLRDRLVLARDLLTESGSCFVQISMENVHRVRALMDEVFGEDNCVSMISYATTSGNESGALDRAGDYILWYAKDRERVKYRELYKQKVLGGEGSSAYKRVELPDGSRMSLAEWAKSCKINGIAGGGGASLADLQASGCRALTLADLTSRRPAGDGDVRRFTFQGREYSPGKGTFKTSIRGLERLVKAGRLDLSEKGRLGYLRYFDDFSYVSFTNYWSDTGSSFMSNKIYVVQTSEKVIERCMLMTTDPGDLVLDPTCGSGTTAVVAEEWGRRWITIDVSRVSIALARRRVMGARFPYWLLADSPEGIQKEEALTGKSSGRQPHGKISQGFVCQRVPHIMLGAIANNAEIDVIYAAHEEKSRALREALGKALGRATPEEWEVPIAAPADWPGAARALQAEFQTLRLARQKAIDESIARNAETEYLYDRPYEDKSRARVAGPFTVESQSPVRAIAALEKPDGSNAPFDEALRATPGLGSEATVQRMIKLLVREGVRQTRKADHLYFSTVTAWPGGRYLHAEAWTQETDGARQRRVAIMFGPEFGTATRADILAAAREFREAGCFDVLLVCAFGFEPYASDDLIGGLVRGKQLLLAQMNNDLHMEELSESKGRGGNSFVIYGEPDVEFIREPDDRFRVRLRGVDVYDPARDAVRNGDEEDIECWMVDDDYNSQVFFARQVFFPDNENVYKAWKTFLNHEIDPEEWSAAAGMVSHPFPRPASGRIAVKVINRFGDEVVKIFDLTNR